MSALGNMIAPVVDETEEADTVVALFSSQVDSFLEFLDDTFVGQTAVPVTSRLTAVSAIRERINLIYEDILSETEV
jgi:hypothetical protein